MVFELGFSKSGGGLNSEDRRLWVIAPLEIRETEAFSLS